LSQVARIWEKKVFLHRWLWETLMTLLTLTLKKTEITYPFTVVMGCLFGMKVCMEYKTYNNAINSDAKKLRCAPLFGSGYGWR